MSSKKLPEAGRNRRNKKLETVFDENSPYLPRDKRNIKRRIGPSEKSNFEESYEMEFETSPPCTPLQSNVGHKRDIFETEDIQSISLSSTEMNVDQSYLKLQCGELLFPENPKGEFHYQSTTNMAEILKDSNVPGSSRTKSFVQNFMRSKGSKGSNIAGSLQSKYLVQNPFVKTKVNKGASAAEPSRFKSLTHQFELPFTKQKISEKFQLSEACRFFLVFMKIKRCELRYMESQLDYCTNEIQKAIREAEQIIFKLEDEPKTVAQESSAAKVQSQKLAYLLSISSRSYSRLNKLGFTLQDCLDLYSKDAENFHISLDRLLEYIVETIIRKCKS